MVAQLASAFLFHRQLPNQYDGDGYYESATAIWQYQEPACFVALAPHHNALTRANFPTVRVLLGIWVKLPSGDLF